jgi:hypothetical protein
MTEIRMTRLRLQGLVLVLATAALLSTWAGAANAYIYPDSTRTYAVGHVHSSSSWNAARATIGVKSGIIGSGDLGSVSFYGFIAEVLWIMPESRSGSVGWCEIGYRRGFKGYDMLTPYWENNLNGQDYTHQVTQVPIAPGDAPEFKIVHYGTGTAWRFYINGNPAKDQFSDYTADTGLMRDSRQMQRTRASVHLRAGSPSHRFRRAATRAARGHLGRQLSFLASIPPASM